MVKLMKLRGQVRLNMDLTYTFTSTLYDGTPFTVDNVTIHDFELSDEFTPGNYTVMGHLYVVQEAKQGDRCALTLPKPNIQYGHQITVNDLQLQPRFATLNDFKAKKMGGTVVSEAPPVEEVVVEAPVEEEVAVEEPVVEQAPVEDTVHILDASVFEVAEPVVEQAPAEVVEEPKLKAKKAKKQKTDSQS